MVPIPGRSILTFIFLTLKVSKFTYKITIHCYTLTIPNIVVLELPILQL